MQTYSKAHITLPYQQKRKKMERLSYRLFIILHLVPVGAFTAFLLAAGDMPFTWISVLSVVLGTAIRSALGLAVIWISYRTWLNRPERRQQS
jgi:hypothetical protein